MRQLKPGRRMNRRDDWLQKLLGPYAGRRDIAWQEDVLVVMRYGKGK
jgi:hypothetical protein